MSDLGQPFVHLRDVVLDYRGLRPLRVQQLDLHAGEIVALLGFDATSADVLVSLITGAAVPDTGEIRIDGQLTTAVTNGEAWLKTLDRFGLIGERSVLIEQFTAEQNLTLSFTMNPDDVPEQIRAEIARIAVDVGLSVDELGSPTGRLSPLVRARLKLGRALAGEPSVLLAEHPTAALSADDTMTFAADVLRVAASRRMATLILTADSAFAHAVAIRVLTLQPGSGQLKPTAGWRRWFS